MTFNQWCAGSKFDTSSRLAFEAVWNALVGGGCSVNAASSLLTDLVQSLPELSETCDEERW